MTDKPKIFVQIASYRDAECQHTVKDMFEKAAFPDRIFAGICWQVIPEEDGAMFQIITRPNQVRINLVNAKQSKGACWARRMTQTLWQGEEYTLQIDSHMRFEDGWDESMLNMLAQCDSSKPVLTTYPPGYEPPDKIHGRWVTALCASHFDDGGILMPKAISYGEEQVFEKPIKGALLSGNFFFAPSEFIKEVPYDPYLYFIGEEISLAVRAYTHDWDLYYPNKPVIYHNYTDAERTGRKTHFTDNSEWWKINDLSYKRVKHMLGTEISTDAEVLKELDIYGLGQARSLDDYQNYSGINFKAKSIAENAATGIFGGVMPLNTEGHPKILVQIASYRDPELQHTVKDLFEKAAYPDRVNVAICWQFIRGVDDDLFEVPYPRPRQVKVIEVDARETKGACWARSLTQKLWTDEEYSLQIDSHMRFEPGWDEKLINMLAECESPKPILSTYPNGYQLPNEVPHKFPTLMHADKFQSDTGILVFLARGMHEADMPKPAPGAFISGNYFFAKSDIIKELPYDPNLYFIGEEISLAVRAWTKGWDIFNPNKPLIHHRWERDGRKTIFEDNSKWWVPNEKSLKRVKHILGAEISTDPEIIKDLDIYGLGSERSLEDYQNYAGVNFKTQTITEDAKLGNFKLAPSTTQIRTVLKPAPKPAEIQTPSMRNLVSHLTHLMAKGLKIKTVYDIGAYGGSWTRELNQHLPNAKFFAFEANPNHEKYLTGLNYFIGVLSDSEKEVEFYFMGNSGDSYYKEKTIFSDNIPKQKVITKTLDSFDIPSPDFIKLDTQGAELDILCGGSQKLKRASLVLMECPVMEYNAKAPVMQDYLDFMAKKNFVPLDVIEIHKFDNLLVQVDLLFIRKTVFKKLFPEAKNYRLS